MVQSITLQTSDPIIVSGDNIGRLAFAASSEASAGDSIKVAGIISVVAEAEFTSAANAASMVFSTSATDTASGQYKITSVGDFLPMNGGQDLGSTTNVFTSLYVDNIQSISEGIVLSDNTPSVTTNALYNVGGSLYFNGSTVGVSYTGTSGVALQGTTFYLNGTGNLSQLNLDNGTDSALNVSGTTLLAGTGVVFEVQNTGGTTLFAVEDSTEVQVIIAAQPAQTGNPFEVRDAFDDIVAYVDVSGNISGNNVIFGDGTTQTTAFTGYQDLSAYATTGDLDTVSGIAQGAADDVSSSSGWLQSQINSNDTDITALQTATGNLDSDLTTVSGLLYNNWNVNVTGNVDSITSNETVIFTGLGSTTITYNNTTNTVSVSGTDTDTTYTAGSGITIDGSDVIHVYGGTGNLQELQFTETSNTVRIGYNTSGVGGSKNIHIGYEAGQESDTNVIAIGTNAGNVGASTSHDDTIWIGREAGFGIGSALLGNGQAIGIGYRTFRDTTSAYRGVAIGDNAGASITSVGSEYGWFSTYVGALAGKSASGNVQGNTSIGYNAGGVAKNHQYSTQVGYDAGSLTSGQYSTYLGAGAGRSVTGSNNVEVRAGENGSPSNSIIGSNSNKIHVYNTIVGDTSSRLYAIGNVGASNLTPDATLEVLPAVSTDVGLIVQGAASQSANLQEWQDSAGTILADVNPQGTISGSGFTFPDGVTQTVAYTGQVAPTGMVSWNLSVSGASDSITDSATVTFTGLGSATITYNDATNTVSVSGTDTDTTYTAGSGLTLDGTEFNIYGGTGQFKQVLFESDLVQIGSSTTANGAESISIGVGAGNNSNGSTNLIAIGGNAGNAATNANLVVSIGDDSCSSSQSLALTNAIGYFAGASASGTSNNYMGILAGNTNKGDNNVGIGNHALDDSDGSGNIEIVAYGLFEVTPTILGDNSNKIHIGRTLIGDTSSRLYAIGNVGASNLTPDATLEILPKVSTDIGLIVQGATSQSANLQEWQNSSASILAYVDTDGMISGSGITYTDGTISTSIFTDVVTDGNTGITYSETTFGGKYVRLTNSLDIEVSIPSGLNTYQYTETLFEQAAAGQITVTGQAGVTLNFRSSNTSAGQYAVITLKKIATDTYILFGDVT